MNAVTSQTSIALATSALMAAIQSELREGESYGGPVFKDGAITYHLILLPGDNDGADQATQIAWAASIGGELPTIEEYAVLYANCKSQFERDWYWSATQHAGDSGVAWIQNFGLGGQNWGRKSYDYRARAIRRLPI